MPLDADRALLTRNTDDVGMGSRLSNEAYVLMAGTLGGLGQLKESAQEALDHPGATAFKIGTAAVLGGTLGFLSQRAGVAGLVARGAAAALGVSFVFEGLKPWSNAMGEAWDATSMKELDRAADKLSRRAGQIAFDTLLAAPFAAGGAFAGRGLRSALSEAPVVATPQASRVAAAEASRVPPFTTRSQTTRPQADFTFTRPRPQAAEPVVLVGEIVDPPPRASSTRRASEPEIIDAEFTVIETPRGYLADSRALLGAGETRAIILHEPGANQMSVVLSPGHPLARNLGSALSELRALEPSWRIESSSLISPPQSRLSPEQVRRILKQYTQADTRPGQIIDVRA